MPKLPPPSRSELYDHRAVQHSPYPASPQFLTSHPSTAAHSPVFPMAAYDYVPHGQPQPHVSSPYYTHSGPPRLSISGYGQPQPGYSPRLDNPSPSIYQPLQDALYSNPLHQHQHSHSHPHPHSHPHLHLHSHSLGSSTLTGPYLSPSSNGYSDTEDSAGTVILASNGDAVYFCKICPTSRSFISKATLKKHIQYCHQEKPMCPFCSTCIRADNMSRHIKKYCPQAGVKKKNQHEIEAERILAESGIIDNIGGTGSPNKKLPKEPHTGEPMSDASILSAAVAMATAAAAATSSAPAKPLSRMDIKNIVDMDLLSGLSPSAAAAALGPTAELASSTHRHSLPLLQHEPAKGQKAAEGSSVASLPRPLNLAVHRPEPKLADSRVARSEYSAELPYQHASGLEGMIAQRKRSLNMQQPSEPSHRSAAGHHPHPTQYQWHLNTPTSMSREQYMTGAGPADLSPRPHTLLSGPQLGSSSGQLSIRTDLLEQGSAQHYLFSLKGQSSAVSSLLPLRDVVQGQDHLRRASGSLELTSYRASPLHHSKSELSPSAPGSGNYLPPLFQLSISPSASYHA